MSTRSIIIVTGKDLYENDRTVRLYKHSDGYPTGNLPLIYEALSKAKSQCDVDFERFKTKRRIPNVDQVVGILIGAATDVYGMGMRIDACDEDAATYSEKFKPKHLGCQGDLEWIYVVNLTDFTVKVYGGGYSGELPQYTYKNGVVDPLQYADQLYPEYQDSERKEIQDGINSIESLGFKVNPKRQRTTKSKPSSASVTIATVIPLKAAA